MRGTRTQHHPSRGWQRPLWPPPAKPHPHLLPSFLVHMNPGWLTLRILGNYLWFPLSGPSSPAHLPPRHIPARWPEKPLPGPPLCCPWRCCSSGPSQSRTPPKPRLQAALGFPFLCHFSGRPCQVLVSALPSQRGWGPAGVKGGETSEFSSTHLLTQQNLCLPGPWHPGSASESLASLGGGC